MHKKCLSLLLCISLPCFIQADTIAQAVRDLNVAQVEQKLQEQGALDPDSTDKLLKIINTKIADLKKQQTSKNRFLNAQVIAGLLTTGLARVGFGIMTSTQASQAAADKATELARNLFNDNASDLTPQVQAILRDKMILETGSFYGIFTGVLTLVGLKQLYNGLTTKNLKNNYTKALAIKELLQQASK